MCIYMDNMCLWVIARVAVVVCNFLGMELQVIYVMMFYRSFVTLDALVRQGLDITE